MRQALIRSTASPIAALLALPIVAEARSIEDLVAEQAEFYANSQAILDKIEEEDREPTDEEESEIQANKTSADKIQRIIDLRSAAQPPQQTTTRRTTAEPSDDPALNNRNPSTQQQPSRATVPANPTNRRVQRTGGFESFGHFALAVQQGSGRSLSDVDDRLRAVATSFGNEQSGAEGGFAVPPEFAEAIMVKVNSEDNLANRGTELTTGRNSMAVPKDETTPWQTSGGVQAYWEGEGNQATNSKPLLEWDTLRLAKLMALVPLSDESLDDAPALESWLRATAPDKMIARINTAIIRGNGVGKPQGILSAASTISVAKETSQPAATVYFANINNMWSRMYAPWRRNAVWLINQDIEPALEGMAFDPDATSKVPAYLPPGGLSDSPYGRLKGRPVVPVEACSTLGTVGDIILVDMAQYWVLRKATQGIATETSIHLYFDQGLTAFRFTFRMNGQPAWRSAITPENGANTRSWAVTLATRS